MDNPDSRFKPPLEDPQSLGLAETINFEGERLPRMLLGQPSMLGKDPLKGCYCEASVKRSASFRFSLCDAETRPGVRRPEPGVRVLEPDGGPEPPEESEQRRREETGRHLWWVQTRFSMSSRRRLS